MARTWIVLVDEKGRPVAAIEAGRKEDKIIVVGGSVYTARYDDTWTKKLLEEAGL